MLYRYVAPAEEDPNLEAESEEYQRYMQEMEYYNQAEAAGVAPGRGRGRGRFVSFIKFFLAQYFV